MPNPNLLLLHPQSPPLSPPPPLLNSARLDLNFLFASGPSHPLPPPISRDSSPSHGCDFGRLRRLLSQAPSLLLLLHHHHHPRVVVRSCARLGSYFPGFNRISILPRDFSGRSRALSLLCPIPTPPRVSSLHGVRHELDPFKIPFPRFRGVY